MNSVDNSLVAEMKAKTMRQISLLTDSDSEMELIVAVVVIEMPLVDFIVVVNLLIRLIDFSTVSKEILLPFKTSPHTSSCSAS